MSLLTLLLALAVVYIAIAKNGAIPDSVSEIAYIIPKWAFTLWLAVICILLLPDMVSTLPDSLTFIGFLCVAGLLCVAASPYYKTEEKTLHYAGGWLCAVSATVATALACWPVLLAWLTYPLTLWLFRCRYHTFWAELYVFLSLVIAINL